MGKDFPKGILAVSHLSHLLTFVFRPSFLWDLHWPSCSSKLTTHEGVLSSSGTKNKEISTMHIKRKKEIFYIAYVLDRFQSHLKVLF